MKSRETVEKEKKFMLKSLWYDIYFVCFSIVSSTFLPKPLLPKGLGKNWVPPKQSLSLSNFLIFHLLIFHHRAGHGNSHFSFAGQVIKTDSFLRDTEKQREYSHPLSDYSKSLKDPGTKATNWELMLHHSREWHLNITCCLPGHTSKMMELGAGVTQAP